jgi:DNA sulfur modification protein DndD
MIFSKISINNFMPYKGIHKISFDLYEDKNIVVIYGDNMRGKTSFLNCIRWVFYGKAFGRHSKLIKRVNIVNKDAANEHDWSTSVQIEFKVDGDEYNLIRALNKRELVSIPKHDADFVEKLGLKINGNPLRSNLIANRINMIMPEQISRFFLFDGELLEEYEMLMIEENDSHQKVKQSIEQVLGVPALISGRNEIRTLLKTAQRMQAKEASKDASLKAQAEELIRLQEKQTMLE